MSLMGTLAKVAIGVAVAKGVKSMSGGGGLLGGASSASRQSAGGSSVGGLEGMMGSILSGVTGGSGSARASKGGSAGGASGGLGGLLEQLTGSQTTSRSRKTSASTGGLGDLLGQFSSQLGGASGGIGGLLGGLATAGAAGGLGSLLSGEKSFGATLNSSFANQGEPDVKPSASQEAVAGLMILAMVQAAKSDGTVDKAEQEKLLGNLGEVSQQEAAFVQAALDAPLDVDALVAQVPDGLEAQVYTMSVMAIDLDSQKEAQYLHSLAQGLGLDQHAVNHIHAELGAPALYA